MAQTDYFVTPYYNKATQAGLIAHYEAVAKEAKAPIIMYSVASRTGCNIEPATVAELVKNVDNIVGVKRGIWKYFPGCKDHVSDRW